ncbi:hypothetical protein [Planococcus sp. SSTMD024]|uniref:hypothetical protein n=1 Tax=Planococcus sp. SSTMD024 TaxID=3242163 RepID=UPI00351E743F
MEANVILGNNIDTNVMVYKLKKRRATNIFVVDYDYYGNTKFLNNVTYTSSKDAVNLFEEFDSVIFYKSLYILPGLTRKRP